MFRRSSKAKAVSHIFFYLALGCLAAHSQLGLLPIFYAPPLFTHHPLHARAARAPQSDKSLRKLSRVLSIVTGGESATDDLETPRASGLSLATESLSSAFKVNDPSTIAVFKAKYYGSVNVEEVRTVIVTSCAARV